MLCSRGAGAGWVETAAIGEQSMVGGAAQHPPSREKE